MMIYFYMAYQFTLSQGYNCTYQSGSDQSFSHVYRINVFDQHYFQDKNTNWSQKYLCSWLIDLVNQADVSQEDHEWGLPYRAS